MGVIFGHLVKPHQIVNGEMVKMPAVYILTPAGFNGNIIISKEYISKGRQKTAGYMIRNIACGGSRIYFVQDVTNGMTEDDCDDILVLLDLLLKSKLDSGKFVPKNEINIFKKDNYTVQAIKKARESINIKGGSY